MTKQEINAILDKAIKDKRIKELPSTTKQREKLARFLEREDEIKEKPKSEDELFYENSLEEQVENLPIPHEIEGELPELPLDLTELSDKQLIYLHGAYNAASARIGWLYAIQEAGENAAKSIVDYHEDSFIATADRKDHGGKAKAQAILKAEAAEYDPDIVVWKRRQRDHSIKAGKYKRLLERFDLVCERLSRQWTMRENERDHS